jgi:hypothetical protein
MHGTDSQYDGGESLARPSESAELPSVASTVCALPNQPDPVAFKQAMDLIRRRRKYFFATVIAYMPVMWVANKISPTFRSMAITFSVWVVLLFITALYSALARCPRCGHYFHMNGMSLLYLRRCLHCQNHINAS